MTDNQWMLEFAKKLNQKMKTQSLAQKELAKLSGVSETTISRYLAGTQMPKIRPVLKIAKALSAGIYELLPFDR